MLLESFFGPDIFINRATLESYREKSRKLQDPSPLWHTTNYSFFLNRLNLSLGVNCVSKRLLLQRSLNLDGLKPCSIIYQKNQKFWILHHPLQKKLVNLHNRQKKNKNMFRMLIFCRSFFFHKIFWGILSHAIYQHFHQSLFKYFDEISSHGKNRTL